MRNGRVGLAVVAIACAVGGIGATGAIATPLPAPAPSAQLSLLPAGSSSAGIAGFHRWSHAPLARSARYRAAKLAAERSLTGAGKHVIALRHAPLAALAAQAAATPALYIGSPFNGLDENQGQGDPPDPQIGVSPQWVLEAVNSSMEAFPRSGGRPRVKPMTYIFGGTNLSDLSDPQISYDAVSGRFVAGMMDVAKDEVMIAVSSTGNPLGSWKGVSLSWGASECPDQPKLGYDDKVIAVSVNLFTGGGCSSDGGNPIGTYLVVIAKAAMLRADNSLPADQGFIDHRSAKIAPARSLSSTSTEYMTSVLSDTSRVLNVFPYLGAPPSGHFSGGYSVRIRVMNDPPPARQRGSRTGLDTNDNRLTDAAWRRGLLFAAGNDGCRFQGDSSEHACARVMSVSTVRRRIVLQDDLGFVGEDAYYPALDPDRQNNLDVVIGFSSPHEYPSVGLIGYTPHGYTDVYTIADGRQPLTGAVQGGVQRLGDYFGAEVDPVRPNAVWAVGEYGKSPGIWGTMIDVMSLQRGTIPGSG